MPTTATPPEPADPVTAEPLPAGAEPGSGEELCADAGLLRRLHALLVESARADEQHHLGVPGLGRTDVSL